MMTANAHISKTDQLIRDCLNREIPPLCAQIYATDESGDHFDRICDLLELLSIDDRAPIAALYEICPEHLVDGDICRDDRVMPETKYCAIFD